MSRSAYPLKLPESVKKNAQRLAKEDGVSLNHWISVAVAQKIGAVETAAEFFKRRSEGGSIEHFRRVLDLIPDNGPDLEEQES